MKMRKVTSTTPISDPKVQLLVAVAALAAAYYRMPLTFLLLILYLSYLLWSYYWTMMSSKFTTGESSATANSVFAGETLTREFKFLNSWLFPLVRAESALFCHLNSPLLVTFHKSYRTQPAKMKHLIYLGRFCLHGNIPRCHMHGFLRKKRSV
jgi:hypothetical protein